MSRKRLVKRFRRRIFGGSWEMRVYADGTARVRYDHPSNDPALELAVAGHTLNVARRVFEDHGYTLPATVPITWRDDTSLPNPRDSS